MISCNSYRSRPTVKNSEAQVAATVGSLTVIEVHPNAKDTVFRAYNGRRTLGEAFDDLGDAVDFCKEQLHRPECLEGLTNVALAKLIERRDAAKVKAVGRVYDLAEAGTERWSEIVERLGDDNSRVRVAMDASEEAAIARAEARRRLGPVQEVCFVAYLKAGRRRG